VVVYKMESVFVKTVTVQSCRKTGVATVVNVKGSVIALKVRTAHVKSVLKVDVTLRRRMVRSR
jgi:hypothetical protein